MNNVHQRCQGLLGINEFSLKFEILLPPLVEQKRIVAKLGALSVETQRLKGFYCRKLDLLVELKQSMLAKAFSWGADELSRMGFISPIGRRPQA